jgi:long-chain acyl-CoA synthetase
MKEIKTPWIENLGGTPAALEYFKGTMFEAVKEAASRYPKYVALDFMGSFVTYEQLTARVLRCARALRAIGIGEGDRVTICMPNMPQAVVLLYAVNLSGRWRI